MLVMTYFHPFTVLDNESVDVPHVSELRRGNDNWETALMKWLEGNVLTYEARNFIQNYFFVAQLRPDFVPDGNKNDEDIFSDEEIDKSKVDIKTLMNAHVESTRDNEEDDMERRQCNKQVACGPTRTQVPMESRRGNK